jgi:hypothetical protein
MLVDYPTLSAGLRYAGVEMDEKELQQLKWISLQKMG